MKELIVALCLCPPQSNDTLPPPSVALPLPEVSLTAEPQEQARGRLNYFPPFTFALFFLFFYLLKHMFSHKAGILSLNGSSCHTFARQETVGEHLRSCGCKCIYKYLFISTPLTTTSTMCHAPPPPFCFAKLVNNYLSKIVLKWQTAALVQMFWC